MATPRVFKRPQAVLDLEPHSDFLYDEAGFAVAARFLEAVDRALDRLLEMPELGAPRDWLNPRLPALRMWTRSPRSG